MKPKMYAYDQPCKNSNFRYNERHPCEMIVPPLPHPMQSLLLPGADTLEDATAVLTTPKRDLNALATLSP